MSCGGSISRIADGQAWSSFGALFPAYAVGIKWGEVLGAAVIAVTALRLVYLLALPTAASPRR